MARGSILLVLLYSLSGFTLSVYSLNHFVIYTNGVFIAMMVTCAIIGWITDVYIGRYRVIQASLLVMWCGSVVFAFVEILQLADTIGGNLYKYLKIVGHLIRALGIVLFQANILQFCIDQLIDFSSSQIAVFIH